MTRLLPALALAFVAQAALAAVNLNTATKDELIALKGIGPAKAQAILDYRAQHGGFQRVEELKDVRGIGSKQFESLKSELTVTPPPAAPGAKAGKAEPKAARVASGEAKPAK